MKLLILLSLTLILTACTDPGNSKTMSSPYPKESSSEFKDLDSSLKLGFSAEDAWNKVLEENPDWSEIPYYDENLIGADSWHTIEKTNDYYVVTVIKGEGDCPAGCIHLWEWVYHVSFDGQVQTVAEERVVR